MSMAISGGTVTRCRLDEVPLGVFFYKSEPDVIMHRVWVRVSDDYATSNVVRYLRSMEHGGFWCESLERLPPDTIVWRVDDEHSLALTRRDVVLVEQALNELQHLVRLLDPFLESGGTIPGLATMNRAKDILSRAGVKL